MLSFAACWKQRGGRGWLRRCPALEFDSHLFFEEGDEISVISARILLSTSLCFVGFFFSAWILLKHNRNREEEKAISKSLSLYYKSISPLLPFEEREGSEMAVAAEAQFHVLAVDDSLIDRKLIERLLKTSSFQVTTVDSGSKALEFLGLRAEEGSPSSAPSNYQHEIQVNLVITDYCMPGMSGYDLLKKIKESSALKDIPVVIMSSENVPSRINRCLEEGAKEFLLKPVKLSDMSKLRPHILKGKCKDEQERESISYDLSANNINNMSGNKRKAMDEGILPVRTRPRFSSSSSNSLTVL